MRHVKGNKELRAEWGKLRRQIVPKVGQLTNDPESISRIVSHSIILLYKIFNVKKKSQQIIEIVRPASRPHDEPVYYALLSSLAKTIILQAETEVVAEKRSAIPLAQVAFTLLETLEHFPTIFFAKLIQRCGGWVIPIVVPMHDVDEFPWNSPEDRIKASGVRRSTLGEGLETTDEYSNRISAVMRVYFHILKIRPTTPLHHMFQLPRIWTWFARMTGDYRLLQDPVAPQLLYSKELTMQSKYYINLSSFQPVSMCSATLLLKSGDISGSRCLLSSTRASRKVTRRESSLEEILRKVPLLGHVLWSL